MKGQNWCKHGWRNSDTSVQCCNVNSKKYGSMCENPNDCKEEDIDKEEK